MRESHCLDKNGKAIPLETVLKPRPSTKTTKICPACLEEVK